jgi:hypothetical protein
MVDYQVLLPVGDHEGPSLCTVISQFFKATIQGNGTNTHRLILVKEFPREKLENSKD